MSGQPSLLDRHAQVLLQLQNACATASRPDNSVRLLAVSKTFPASDVLSLAEHGQLAFGENYLQEGVDKVRYCADQRPELKIEWHFIGPIQSNKTRPIAENFDWVQSIERDKIALRLNEQRTSTKVPLNVCIQVNVSGEATKSGCKPSEVQALATLIATLPNLALRGVMAIPEATRDEAALRAQFSLARTIFEKLKHEHLKIDTLSLGMSSDMTLAIANDSTMVRVGSAIFGARQ